MNNKILFSSLFSTEKANSSSLPAWAYWLLLSSAIIIGLFGSIWMIVTYIKVYKLKKKIDKDYKKAAEDAVIKIKGEKLPDINPKFKELFTKNILNDLDVFQLVNTAYLNEAKNILLVGNELEYSYSILRNMCVSEINLFRNSINSKIWNSAVLKQNDLFKNSPYFIDEEKFNKKNFKLIYFINSNYSSYEIYKNYYHKLEENGMIVVILNSENKSDLKLLTKELKNKKIRYEISKNKEKFLYIVNSN